MREGLVCDYCGDKIVEEPIRRGSRVYCSEACVFEAGRSTDCAGRTDIQQASLEEEMAFRENPPES